MVWIKSLPQVTCSPLPWEDVAWEAVVGPRTQSRRRAVGEAEVGEPGQRGMVSRESLAGAPPVLTPVASASEQFSGRGTQEVMVQNPDDMEGCFSQGQVSL